MQTYLYQVGATDPKGWRSVQADSIRDAALDVAHGRGAGEHVVYVAMGRARHPNGAPVVVTAFTCRVTAPPARVSV